MRRASSAVLALVFLASFLLAAPAGNATHQGVGACHPGFLWQDDEISLWFHGKKAFVKVYQHNASNPDEATAYAYHGGDIVERDPATNRTYAKMSLGRAYPQTSNCEVTQEGDFTNVTITITDDVKLVGPGNRMVARTASHSLQATAAFVYHFNHSSAEAKFDLQVISWPWLGANELAYEFDVNAQGGTVQTADNGVGILNATGAQVGYVQWAPNATATYSDGHSEDADVESNATGSGTSSAHVVLGFANVTPGYAKLDYDPVVGVGLWVIVNGHLVALPVPGLGAVRSLLGGLR